MDRRSPRWKSGLEGARHVTARFVSARRAQASRGASRRRMTPTDHSAGKWAAAFAPRSPNEKRYWLVKSEPDLLSFDGLRAAAKPAAQLDVIVNFAQRYVP